MTVLDRTTKLRIRRVFRRRQKQVEAVTTHAEEQFDNNFIARLERLLDVQRFVVGWLFLIVVIVVATTFQTVGLSQYYTKTGPVPGGTYNEGMVGTFSNANPLYATGPVDTNLSRLIFAGLFKYDDTDHLVGDLAKDYSIDSTGRVYTVHLKPYLTWQDGKPLTSKDVLFTYGLIQNADVHSPLFSSWQGIAITAPDALTVTFRLPSALAPFPYSLTTGIVPQHVLGSIPIAQLRSSSFNTTQPVGAGPFAWDALQLGDTIGSSGTTALISLKAFSHYNGGEPKLTGFVLHTFDNKDAMLNAYKKRSIEAMAGLDSIPGSISKDKSSHIYNFTTTAATMVFFKTTAPIFDDAAVRQALVLGSDRATILKSLSYQVRPVEEPLLIGQLGYDKAYEQTAYSPAEAAAALDKDGWTVAAGKGIRSKNGLALRFQISAEDTPDNRTVLDTLQRQWKAIGVDMRPALQQEADFQNTVETHSYAALLYGISIGPDPDVFVYWDGTQADVRSNSRLNFSEYKSSVADTALEAGRTRQDPVLRILKYKPFLKAWQQDAPALGLYQPRAIYVTRGTVPGLTEHTLNTDADRYYSVDRWTVKTGQVPK